VLTHARLADALTGIRPGGAAVICGVEVRRTPEVDGRFAPRGGRFRVNQGPEQLLLASIDALAREAGLKPLAGGPPWREPDDGPAPSYGRRVAAPDGPAAG
jgi:hypothetical protein